MKAAAKTRTPKPARRKPAVGAVAVKGHAPAFREIIGQIQSARQRAFQAVNPELIGLYWRVGEELTWNQAAASFAFFFHARSANRRASFAPRSRQSELMSQSSFGQ